MGRLAQGVQGWKGWVGGRRIGQGLRFQGGLFQGTGGFRKGWTGVDSDIDEAGEQGNRVGVGLLGVGGWMGQGCGGVVGDGLCLGEEGDGRNDVGGNREGNRLHGAEEGAPMELEGREVGWAGDEDGMDFAGSKGGGQWREGKPGTAELEVGEDWFWKQGRMMEDPGFRGVEGGKDLSVETGMIWPGVGPGISWMPSQQQAMEGERGVLQELGQGCLWR